MNKIFPAILLFDLCVGLLLLGLWEEKNTETADGAAVIRTMGVAKDVSEAADADEDENIKKIAITFDDGPHPSYTEQLLDGLKERGVHATFFVTGEHAKLHPDIIKRMHEEGHLIGNHTYSHIQLTSKNREKFKQELIDTNAVIQEIT